jgi:excisionase family DNA binding protein
VTEIATTMAAGQVADDGRERYITAREVAERVGLSPDTILRYYREGRIPGRRMAGQVRPVRFLWSEIEAVWDCAAQLSLEDAG